MCHIVHCSDMCQPDVGGLRRYTVFQSAANMADSTYWFTYLNTPDAADVNDFIIEQFKTLHQEYVLLLCTMRSWHCDRVHCLSTNAEASRPQVHRSTRGRTSGTIA